MKIHVEMFRVNKNIELYWGIYYTLLLNGLYNYDMKLTNLRNANEDYDERCL